MNILTKDIVRQIGPEIDAAIADVLAKYGLDAKPGFISWGAAQMKYSVEARVPGDPDVAGGVNPQSLEARAYELYGASYGLEAGLLGVIFESNGNKFRFTGIKTSRPKFPIDGVSLADGRQYKFTRNIAAKINAAGKAVA